MGSLIEKLENICELIHFDATCSTQSEAKKWLEQNRATRPLLFNTFKQTKGFGRYDRTWWSGQGSLSFSIVLPFDKSLFQFPVTLMIGLSIIKSLEKTSVIDTLEIRWPNDIYHKNKKLGGILTEKISDVSGRDILLIGVGLNINNSSSLAPPDLKNKIISISEIINKEIPLDDVLVCIVKDILFELNEPCDIDTILIDFKVRDNLIGSYISIVTGENKQYEGEYSGIDKRGGLVLKKGSRYEHFYSIISIEKIDTIDHSFLH